MAYKFQLSDARADSSIRAVAGACPSSDDFVQLVNTVTRRLMRRGNFHELEWLIRVCLSSCNVVWPEFVGTVLAVKFCRHNQSPMQNKWYSIIGTGTCGSFGPGIGFREGNTSPVHNQVSGTQGKLIRYYPIKNIDIGKTITIYGKQFGGQPLMEFVDGAWRDGITITAAAPFGTSTVLVTEITSVVREASQGSLYLYEYDATTDLLRDLAIYSPNETNPRRRSSIITGSCGIPFCTDENGAKSAKLDALVKLDYRPMVNDWDFMLIDNFDALALGIQALRLEQASQMDEALKMWVAAITEMNYETRNKQPELQTAIRLNIWGDGTPAMVNPI